MQDSEKKVILKRGSPLKFSNTGSQRNLSIGGFVGELPKPVAVGTIRALGDESSILTPDESKPGLRVIADWDCCFIDDRPVENIESWKQIISENRLQNVEGAFAIAWMTDSSKLFLARDGAGERRLYYTQLDHGLVFATSLHTLLATGGVTLNWDRSSILAYLACAYVPGRQTMIEGIHELLPGEMLAYHKGAVSVTSFWEIPDDHSNSSGVDDVEYYSSSLRTCLERAVRRRLPENGSDISATLSGGIDSSLVVALASKVMPKPLQTYSISFGESLPNELEFSSMVARHCGAKHQILELPPSALIHHLDETIGFFSEPIGDPLTVPNALLFREAAKHGEIVLNGEGGDPCFGGPKNLPMLVGEWLGMGIEANGSGIFSRKQRYLQSYQKCYNDFGRMLTDEMLDVLVSEPPENRFASFFGDPRWESFVNRLMAINIACKGGQNILAKVDQLSRPFGVTARSPLFDRSIIELSMQIPPQMKLQGVKEKFVLKKAVADLLPQTILDRPKCGMLVPVKAWFSGPLQKQAHERLLDGLTPFNLIKKDYLERLLTFKLGGLWPRHGGKIWLLLTLEAWLRQTWENYNSTGRLSHNLK